MGWCPTQWWPHSNVPEEINGSGPVPARTPGTGSFITPDAQALSVRCSSLFGVASTLGAQGKNRGGIEIKPQHVKNHLWVLAAALFVLCRGSVFSLTKLCLKGSYSVT